MCMRSCTELRIIERVFSAEETEEEGGPGGCWHSLDKDTKGAVKTRVWSLP